MDILDESESKSSLPSITVIDITDTCDDGDIDVENDIKTYMKLNKERTFGKQGRKQHDVSTDIPLYPTKVIEQNEKGQFYVKDVKIKSLILEVSLKKYQEMSGHLTLIIPDDEKKKQIDNGVFCCCEMLYEQQSEFEENDDEDNKTKTKHQEIEEVKNNERFK